MWNFPCGIFHGSNMVENELVNFPQIYYELRYQFAVCSLIIGCGHCKNMKPAYGEAAHKLALEKVRTTIRTLH